MNKGISRKPDERNQSIQKWCR